MWDTMEAESQSSENRGVERSSDSREEFIVAGIRKINKLN